MGGYEFNVKFYTYLQSDKNLASEKVKEKLLKITV